MSDPIMNDYTTVPTLSEAETRIAVCETVLRDDRRGFSRFDTREMLDMLGILRSAHEMLGRPFVLVPVSQPTRDGVGRLRATQVPAEAIPAPFTPEPCQSGKHMKPKPGRCHECKLERRRAAYRLKHGEPKNAVRGRVEPDGRRPCGSGEHDLRVDGRQRKDNGTWFCVPCNARRDAVRKASVRAAREAWQIAHKGNAA